MPQNSHRRVTPERQFNRFDSTVRFDPARGRLTGRRVDGETVRTFENQRPIEKPAGSRRGRRGTPAVPRTPALY